MKITRIKVENFRSIRSTEIATDNLNIIVGQNNCGKTNFFEAIEFFFNGPARGGISNDLKHKQQRNLDILVEIEFSGAQKGARQMRHEGNKKKILSVLGESDTVTISRSSVDPKKRKIYVEGSEVNPGTGIDTALNDFLPNFEYIHTKQYYDSVAKYNKTSPIGIMLSGVLSKILEKNEQYLDFQNKFKELFEGDDSAIKTQFDFVGGNVKVNLEKQFPDTTKVQFEVSPPQFDDLLKNFETTIDDGIETSAEEKGDGMQRALMLAIIQTYAEHQRHEGDKGKSFLFYIDEAELHLHPTAQRNLKNVLLELAESTDQVFINTHSSVFVADNHPNQKIFKAEKNNGETEIEAIDDISKPYVVYELLGGSPSDLLLPRNFLIVEGKSEFEFLTRVIKRFYPDNPGIQIIEAKGDIDQSKRTINAIEKAFTPLEASIYKDKLVILIDQPSSQTAGGVRSFLSQNRGLSTNSQFFQLPCRDLEQYYPSQSDPVYGNWRKKQSDLDKNFNGQKKKQLAKHVGDSLTKEQFEKEMPVVFDALKKTWELAY